jgi:hypothetical protein
MVIIVVFVAVVLKFLQQLQYLISSSELGKLLDKIDIVGIIEQSIE